MKVLIMAILSCLSIMANADVVVEKVEQKSVIIPACPVCPGGPVETTTTFTISEYSCRQFPEGTYGVKVSEEPVGISNDTRKVVAVEMVDFPMDCRGPERKYTYQVSTKELEAGVEYVLENRSVLKVE